MAILRAWLPLNQCKIIGRFSNDRQRSNDNEMTPTNHNRRKQHDEPIIIPDNYELLDQSAGKVTLVVG